ncbi:MAG: hypothetical protein ABI867_05020 [Kofleriaceae bacterium]
MSEPSATEIAAMRADAERAQKPPPAKHPKSKRRSRDRVKVEVTEDGGLVTIQYGPVRDREVWLGLLVLPAGLALGLAGNSGGAIGVAIAAACIVGVLVLIFATASATHLRWTAGGDFLLYKRNPRRPTWVGRCSDLTVDTTVTKQQGRSIATLKFAHGGKHFFPLTSADTLALHGAARAAGMVAKDFRW